MILGIGLDIEEKSRIQIATENEYLLFQKLSDRDGEFRESNFVILEALYKAMGCPASIDWTEIEIYRQNGKPQILMFGSMLQEFPDMLFHVSVSHSDGYICAVVIIESNPD